jgi:rhodanese-related sulfurtransferase
MKEISVQELKDLINSQADFQLIDVREPSEFEQANLNGELIPLQTLPNNIDKISKDKKVVIHCKSGKRSANAILYLEQNFNYTNLINLKGGIIAWRDEFDNSLEIS